jgi:hypothetical protein
VTPRDIDVAHGIGANDNQTWRNKRKEWTDVMWAKELGPGS